MFNLADFIIIFILLIFAVRNNGLVQELVHLGGLIFSFIISIRSYETASQYLLKIINISPGYSKTLSFIVIWLTAEALFFALAQILVVHLPKMPKKLSKVLGVLPAVFDGLIIVALLSSLIVALPIGGPYKRTILDSYLAPKLLSSANVVESRLRVVFNDAIIDTLNFLSVAPSSDQSVELGFELKEDEISYDPIVEIEMFNRVNRERKENSLSPLKFDEDLRSVSREYGKQMILFGFFSHNSQVDGSTPDQRITNAGIPYTITGENLAFAPNVDIAHQGLMNSPGHRANILSPEYGKVGIGVVDAGIFGKIFVQEFTD